MSEAQVTPSISALAASRANVVLATTASESQQASHTKLLTRKAELQADAAETFRAARADGDADGKLAMKAKIIDADLADLEVVINASSEKMREATSNLAAANQQCQRCQLDATREENAIALATMKQIVLANEEAYVASVAELHRLHVAVNGRSLGNGTTWACHQPTQEHRELVSSHAVPRLRA
jgi:hypothetical protein